MLSKATKPTTTNSSFEPEKSEESARRAAAADAADRPLEPEIAPEISGETPKETPTVHIDPAQMHGLMVAAIKGLVLRVDLFLGWKNHPDDQWCETTTTVVEILLDKYFGVVVGPEAAFIVQVGSHTIANMPELLSPPEEKQKAERAGEFVESAKDDIVWQQPGSGAA